MTTRTILLTLAATVAPLYAQQPTTPAPAAAQAFTTLAVPAAPAPAATPEQRAAVFNALALLPQDISDFSVLPRVGDNLLQLAQSGKFPECSANDLPPELLALDNIAVAASAATPATYALLQQVLVNIGTMNSSLQLADNWAGGARETLRDSIIEGLILRAESSATLPEGTAGQAHIPASYAVITGKPGHEAMLQECQKQLLAKLRESGKPGISPVEDANGFCGVRVEVTEAYKDELDSATEGMAPSRRALILEGLAKHPIHILTRLQGNALIIALCENPQELRLAASPAESLLATDKLTACDNSLDKGMIAYAYTGPALSNVANAVNMQPSLNLAAATAAAFNQLGVQEPANKAAYDRAAAALAFLGAELQKLIRPVTLPSTLNVWCDGDLHLTLTGDAQGCSYTPGTLRLAAMADAPRTTLYAETTPLNMGMTLPSANTLLEAALNVAEGFTLTLADADRQQAEASLQMAKAFMPELQALAAAGSTITSGMDGQVAIVLDSAHAPLPPIAKTQPGLDAETPRFALFTGLRDRSKLSQGWEGLMQAAGKIAGKLGMAPEIVRFLPIQSRMVGNAMSYTIALPFFSQDVIPSIAVTDTGFTLGSSANLTTQVANSATGTTPFTGAVFALRFKPLARTLRSLATALDHDAEEAEPAAASNVRLEKEKDKVVFATVGGENGPTTIFLSTELDEVEDEADGLSLAAYVAEHMASIAEGVYGTSTIANGIHTLHVQVKMKK